MENGKTNPANSISDLKCIDIDGNSYRTVKIGNQIWMAENLKVTHYRNGDEISKLPDDSDWSRRFVFETEAYCDYENDKNNSLIYGHLYNWFAVTEKRNIAPEGWHVPSDMEWQILFDCLGGEKIAGGKMKEIGTTHWTDPNQNATNDSGFTALPGGSRSDYDGAFNFLGEYGGFWSSTDYGNDSEDACAWDLGHRTSAVLRDKASKRRGWSIRLVKD